MPILLINFNPAIMLPLRSSTMQYCCFQYIIFVKGHVKYIQNSDITKFCKALLQSNKVNYREVLRSLYSAKLKVYLTIQRTVNKMQLEKFKRYKSQAKNSNKIEFVCLRYFQTLGLLVVQTIFLLNTHEFEKGETILMFSLRNQYSITF